MAFVLGLPGLRAVAARGTRLLAGCNHSALSHALRRPSSLRMVQALLEAVAWRHRPGRKDLVALDSMPLTLPATLQHGCALVTPTTAGGGVLWAFALNAARGVNPIRILKTIEGGWSDARLIDGVELIARGPVYLMDRGFYAIDLVAHWIGCGVRFIVRAKKTKMRYELLWTMGAARRIGTVRVTQDAVVRMGSAARMRRPRVRLVRSILPDGEELILVSGMLDASAEYLMESYRQRWQIERFHYYLKETLGLAHLYSFQKNGLAFLAHVAVLLCVLLLFAADANARPGYVVDRLRELLSEVRRASDHWGLWRPNTMRKGQTRHLKKHKNP